MITLIDYGAGNLRSISNAFQKLGVQIETKKSGFENADALVLPGVGNFGDAMAALKPVKKEIIEAIDSGTPFLGLCLGLQVLFEGSKEAEKSKGLGILPGKCLKFDEKSSGKVPHMGWNQISKLKGPLFSGIKDGENFYFVHSYYVPIIKETSAVCNYGVDFSAAIQKDNVFSCQFHPERSAGAGLKVLKNFLDEVRQ